MAKENEDEKVLASLAKRQVDAGLDDEPAEDLGDKLTDKLGDTKDKVVDALSDSADKLGDTKDKVVDKVGDLFHKGDNNEEEVRPTTNPNLFKGVTEPATTAIKQGTGKVAETVHSGEDKVSDALDLSSAFDEADTVKTPEDVKVNEVTTGEEALQKEDPDEAVKAFANRFTKGAKRTSTIETVHLDDDQPAPTGVTIDPRSAINQPEPVQPREPVQPGEPVQPREVPVQPREVPVVDPEPLRKPVQPDDGYYPNVKPVNKHIDEPAVEPVQVDTSYEPESTTEVKHEVVDDNKLTDAQQQSLLDSIEASKRGVGFKKWKDNLGHGTSEVVDDVKAPVTDLKEDIHNKVEHVKVDDSVDPATAINPVEEPVKDVEHTLHEDVKAPVTDLVDKEVQPVEPDIKGDHVEEHTAIPPVAPVPVGVPVTDGEPVKERVEDEPVDEPNTADDDDIRLIAGTTPVVQDVVETNRPKTDGSTSEPVAVASTSEPVAKEVVTDKEVPPVAPVPAEQKVLKPKKKRKGLKWLLWLLIALLVALLGWFGVKNFGPLNKGDNGADNNQSQPANANKAGDKADDKGDSNDKGGVAKTPSFPSVTRDQETATYPKISDMPDGKNPNGKDPAYYKNLEKVDVKQLVHMIKDKKDFVLYVGRPTCPDCRIYLPIQASVLKSLHQKIYYLDVDDATKVTKDKDGNKKYTLDAQTKNFLQLVKVEGTPWILRIEPKADGADGETNIHYTTPDRATYTDQTGAMLQEFLTK